jgi:hypothetical protein
MRLKDKDLFKSTELDEITFSMGANDNTKELRAEPFRLTTLRNKKEEEVPNQAWWCTPVITVIQEVKAGEWIV